MRAKAKLWRVGFANNNRTSRLHARNKQIISLRNIAIEDRRAHRRMQPLCISEIFDRDRQAMKPTFDIACISSFRIGQTSLSRARRHDRIDRAIHLIDAI